MDACVIPADHIRAEDTGEFSFKGFLLEHGSAPSRTPISLFKPKPKNTKSFSCFFPVLMGKGQETPSLSAYYSFSSTYQSSIIDDLRNAAYEQILSFKSLDNNWDGFGAIPLGAKCATSALRLINYLGESELGSIDDLFPNTNGSVCIKWVNIDGERLTLSLGAESFSFYMKKNGSEVELYDDLHINDISASFLISKIKSIINNV